MRYRRLNAMVCLLIGLTGCGGGLESVPATPPPAEAPKLPAEASLRPVYQMRGKGPQSAGTAFVIVDKAGKSYFLTAAHIMDNDAEWQQAEAVNLEVMGGPMVARSMGRPVHLGKAFDRANASTDLVIWPLEEGGKATPLKLAAADPKRNEWVWAVGQEPGSVGPQKLYRCKVTGTEMSGLLLQQHDRFKMQGFSGGPLVNAQGEVVGSVLGGNAPMVLACKVSSIRERLKEAKVELP